MIVRQFLHWVRTASSGERAEATGALARAFLHSDLSESDRAAAEGAMIMLLDDPSPLVRRTLAEAFAGCENAPPVLVYALANDQPDVAEPVLRQSPLLVDADLVDAVASGEAERQIAIASRVGLRCPVSAAIAEVGCAEACLVVLENETADMVAFSLDRIVERFGHLAAVREALLNRPELQAPARQALVATLSASLADFVTARAWLAEDRAHGIAREACEKATVALAADSPEGEVRLLVGHLRESGQLTAGLMLRSLLCGRAELFEQALADLAEMPLSRVCGIVYDRRGAGFRALYDKAGLPATTFPVFREVLDALREEGFAFEPGNASRLKRRIIERVLTRCEAVSLDEIEPLLVLLRRYAAEAAREEARLFCDELTAEGRVANDCDVRLVAA